MRATSPLVLCATLSLGTLLGCGAVPGAFVGNECQNSTTPSGTLECHGDRALLCVGGYYQHGVETCPACQHVTNTRTAVGCREPPGYVVHGVTNSGCDRPGTASCSPMSQQVLTCTNGQWTVLTTCPSSQMCSLTSSGRLGCVNR